MSTKAYIGHVPQLDYHFNIKNIRDIIKLSQVHTFHILGPDRGLTSLTLRRDSHAGPALCLDTGHLRRKLQALITPARTVNSQHFLPTRRHYKTTEGMFNISAENMSVNIENELITLRNNGVSYKTCFNFRWVD